MRRLSPEQEPSGPGRKSAYVVGDGLMPDPITSQFFGMLTGVVPMRSFFSPAHLIRLIGVRDFLHLARARSRQEPSEPPG
jgi:hypothetical protein